MRSTLLLVLFSLVPLRGFALPERFDPESHFPRECFFYASFHAGALRTGLMETPAGRILTHPGVIDALGKLPERLRAKVLEGSEELTRVVGKNPLELLDLFSGEIALTISGVDMMNGPRMAFAVELGPRKAEILDLAGRLVKMASGSIGGGEPQTSEHKGFTVTKLAARFGPSFEYAVVSSHIVLAIGGGVEPIIDRFAAGGDGTTDALRFNAAFARAKLQTSGFTTAAAAFVNWEAIRTAIATFAGDIPMGQEMQRGFAAVGLDKLASATYRVGFREGDFEAKAYLDSPGGLSGILGLLGECIAAPEDPSALARIPACATEIAAFSVLPGRLLRGALERLHEGFPESSPAVDGFVAGFERATGFSVSGDLFALPRLSVYAFNALPPAGGLLPDWVVVARTSQLEPYLVLLDKLARKIGAEITGVRVADRNVAHVTAGRLLSRLGIEGWDKGFGLGAGSFWESEPEPSLSLAFAPVDDDWMAAASSPQAIGRYFSSYSKAPSAAADEGVSSLVRREAGSDAAVAVVRGGRHFIAAYNTAVSLATLMAPLLEKELKSLGITVARLPAGEDFVSSFRDGFLLMRKSKDGLLLHGRRVVSNVIGSPSLLAGLISLGASAAAKKAAGQITGTPGASSPEARLKTLGSILKAYAASAGAGAYPMDPAGGVIALQKVVDAGLVPDYEVLVHPASKEKPAKEPTDGEKAALRDENVSYELVPWKQGPTDNPSRLLAYEKQPYDGKGRHALFVDSSVKYFPEDAFRALLEEQSRRYGKKAER